MSSIVPAPMCSLSKCRLISRFFRMLDRTVLRMPVTPSTSALSTPFAPSACSSIAPSLVHVIRSHHVRWSCLPHTTRLCLLCLMSVAAPMYIGRTFRTQSSRTFFAPSRSQLPSMYFVVPSAPRTFGPYFSKSVAASMYVDRTFRLQVGRTLLILVERIFLLEYDRSFLVLACTFFESGRNFLMLIGTILPKPVHRRFFIFYRRPCPHICSILNAIANAVFGGGLQSLICVVIPCLVPCLIARPEKIEREGRSPLASSRPDYSAPVAGSHH